MASHTEPHGRHTEDELMHPGRDHHLKQNSSSDIACPDPSAHNTKDKKLQNAASTAALYVTSPAKKDTKDILDKDGKLSSASAATSLKHAQAVDLPSFPVVGINSDSAGGAALLANKNQKPFEHWKPDPSASAAAAATLAKDYKMAPLWQPELSAAGSKAALLAHKDGGKLDLWMPSPSAEGNSAANIALKNKGLSPQLDYGYTADGRNKALLAATGALDRSRSTKAAPPPVAAPLYPDAANSAHNALNAATVANRPSTRQANPDSNRLDSNAMEAARVRHIGQNLPKEMWGEKPPVDIEVQEAKHQAALRASTISMAKGMYEYQQRHAEGQAMSPGQMGQAAAVMSHNRSSTDTTIPDIRQQAVQYIHLQEAAHRLAEERLAKLDPDGAARYREHYGYSLNQPRNRLSIRGRTRRRADSETTRGDDDSSDDEATARRIRSQMSGLKSDLAIADEQKRKTDRAALMAAAEKKVHAQMHNMDEQVFADTGKVSPAMMEEWEAKARAKAKSESDQRMVNHGKTAIGSGKYMSTAEIEAIARARLQPTFDEISETAEKRRARDEELRLDAEQKRREEADRRQKDNERKVIEKMTRDEEKTAAKAEKQREKDEKKLAAQLEKERKAEEKRMAKEEKRKSKDTRRDADHAKLGGTPVVAAERPSTATQATSANSDVVEPREAEEEAEEDGEPLERKESLLRSPDGSLRPNIERHVTSVESSDSEDETAEPVIAKSVSKAESIPIDIPVVNIKEPAEGTELVPTGSAAGTDPAIIAETAAVTESATVAEPTTVTKSAKAVEEPKSPTTPRGSGFGRIMNKLKRRSQPATAKSSSSKQPVDSAPVAATVEPTEPAVHDSVNAEEASTGLGIADAGRASPSSFRRGRDVDDVSSISSSGKEEEGVGSMLSRGLGLGKGKKAAREEDADTDDEFEEARDNFDESLAPPPSFGGQAKSTSPVRETKFVEEL